MGAFLPHHVALRRLTLEARLPHQVTVLRLAMGACLPHVALRHRVPGQSDRWIMEL